MSRMEKRRKKKCRDDFTREAYLGIRRMFFLNEIIPGQKISYGDLAKRLKMSTTPVIQALMWLEYQGFVRHESNRGYFTEPNSLKEIKEIYEFRELIEVSLLPKTIAAIDENGLKKLKKALDNHHKALREIYLKDRMVKDMEFHLTLAELSRSSLQIKSLKSLFDLLYLKYRGNILFVTPMERVDGEHLKIYEYIADKNLEMATQVLRQHISNVKDHAIECFEKKNRERQISPI